ncbi:MAG: transposase family protein, partial [Verrucomicrobia bacterium]|nr:transposase family protein [Verrucomicrobiota bacterium]
MSGQQTKSLLQALGALRDPRRYKGWRHRQVASLVAIATAAMMAGNNCLQDIGDFAQHLNQNQLRSLRVPCSFQKERNLRVCSFQKET